MKYMRIRREGGEASDRGTWAPMEGRREVLGATSLKGKYGGEAYAEAPSLVAVNVMPRNLVAL